MKRPKLEKRGYAAKLKSQLDRANLDSARAALERAKLDLARTTVEAPTAGTVEVKPARIGDYLMVGGACVTLVRMDPLLVIGAISERDIAHLRPGMPATVKLIASETRQRQVVRFVSPTAVIGEHLNGHEQHTVFSVDDANADVSVVIQGED